MVTGLSMTAAVLSGKFDPVPGGLSYEEKDKWQIAKAWDEALASRHAVRPCTLPRLDKVEELRVFADLICPRMLAHDMMIKRVPREVQETKRAKNQAKILDMLESYYL